MWRDKVTNKKHEEISGLTFPKAKSRCRQSIVHHKMEITKQNTYNPIG
jgi:hypothetical protein